eukprot:scaffold909_cov575-Prasinococcus_capsulatus_cf.AAC.11
MCSRPVRWSLGPSRIYKERQRAVRGRERAGLCGAGGWCEADALVDIAGVGEIQGFVGTSPLDRYSGGRGVSLLPELRLRQTGNDLT